MLIIEHSGIRHKFFDNQHALRMPLNQRKTCFLWLNVIRLLQPYF